MLVKCNDGQYYRDPLWEFETRTVKVNDEVGAVLISKSQWETARANIGLPIRRTDKLKEQVPAIFKGKLADGLQYNIRFTEPPQPPTRHSGASSSPGNEPVHGV
jgi:hypothetical protein